MGGEGCWGSFDQTGLCISYLTNNYGMGILSELQYEMNKIQKFLCRLSQLNDKVVENQTFLYSYFKILVKC